MEFCLIFANSLIRYLPAAGRFRYLKNTLYTGPHIAIKADGILIRKKKLLLRYQDITSIQIKKARLTRGWLGLILLGIVLDIALFYLLYLFLTNFYDLSGFNPGHAHYSRRSPGIVIGILLILPILVTLRIKRYFTKPVMVIIQWDRGEFRIKLSELKLTAPELQQYLAGKVSLVTEVVG
jgi:hypothetical protein